MTGHEVGLGQTDVAADHVERRVAEDLLEAEHVATVDEVAPGERVAERVRTAAGPDGRPSPEPGDRQLDPACRQGRPPASAEERIPGGDGRSGREIADERPPGTRPDRHDPLLGALAHDMERPVRPDVADPQRGEFGQPQPSVEQHERQRPLPLVGQGQEAPQLGIGERGDEPVRHLRSAQPSEASRRGELLGRAPVAEGLQTAEVAGDRLGRERGPQFEEPGPELGRSNSVDRPRLTEPVASLAKLLEDPPPGAALAALSDSTPQWFLQLDHDEPAGVAIRPHLPGSDGRPTGKVEIPLALASIPLSRLLEKMTLDPLTVSDEPGYWARIVAQTNIPEPIRNAIATLD